MSYSGIDEIQLTSKKRKPWLDALGRKSFFAIMDHISVGRFVVEDQGETFAFGQSADTAKLTASVTIHDARVFRDVVLRGTIGAGEAYMLGYWSTPDLLKVVRVMVLNMKTIERLDSSTSIRTRLSNAFLRMLNSNTLSGSRRNIGAHYDLGNDFFSLFLDPEMMYSSAIYPASDASLQRAALNKLEVVCQKLQLKPSDHLLEIGTGWGGMAIYAARHFGCKVTTTTISQQQYEFARQRVAEEGLSDQVTVLLNDYRELRGSFDKLVSIEMIEAVGHQFYSNFFATCSKLLKDDGIMVIQAITIPDQRYQQAKYAIDFIQKYIFPGGCLPSNAVIARHVADDTDMQISALQDITHDYARTLADWRARFHARIQEVKQLGYDERFVRMWEFYLCYCEGGFTERVISTAQFTLVKPNVRLA